MEGRFCQGDYYYEPLDAHTWSVHHTDDGTVAHSEVIAVVSDAIVRKIAFLLSMDEEELQVIRLGRGRGKEGEN